LAGEKKWRSTDGEQRAELPIGKGPSRFGRDRLAAYPKKMVGPETDERAISLLAETQHGTAGDAALLESD